MSIEKYISSSLKNEIMGIINSFIGNSEGTLKRQNSVDVKIRAADLV
jgi:hypothetical protein